MTLKTGVMAAENSDFYHHRNKLHFKIYSNNIFLKHHLKFVIIFHNNNGFTVFLNTALGSTREKRLKKKLLTPNF